MNELRGLVKPPRPQADEDMGRLRLTIEPLADCAPLWHAAGIR